MRIPRKVPSDHVRLPGTNYSFSPSCSRNIMAMRGPARRYSRFRDSLKTGRVVVIQVRRYPYVDRLGRTWILNVMPGDFITKVLQPKGAKLK